MRDIGVFCSNCVHLVIKRDIDNPLSCMGKMNNFEMLNSSTLTCVEGNQPKYFNPSIHNCAMGLCMKWNWPVFKWNAITVGIVCQSCWLKKEQINSLDFSNSSILETKENIDKK